jgi:AraC-like DNA-binding protein
VTTNSNRPDVFGDSPTTTLISNAGEEFARLATLFSGQQCAGRLRGVDGVVTPVGREQPCIHEIDDSPPPAMEPCDKNHCLEDGTVPAAPIYDAKGALLANLEVVRYGDDRSVANAKLIKSILSSTALDVSERCFRLHYPHHWILATMQRDIPESFMLLAVDRDCRLAGADREAREFLKKLQLPFERGICIAELFSLNRSHFLRRSSFDITTEIVRQRQADPWIAVLTPPYVGIAEGPCDPRSLLHSRPRRNSLVHYRSSPLAEHSRFGLSGYALRKIEAYIDAHIDSTLDINELAGVVRMSCSHFTRSFYRTAGVTPHKFVVQCRVLRASKLLTTTDLPLTEIALSIGFSDQSHFSRRFSEIVGVPPGAFRGRTVAGAARKDTAPSRLSHSLQTAAFGRRDTVASIVA